MARALGRMACNFSPWRHMYKNKHAKKVIMIYLHISDDQVRQTCQMYTHRRLEKNSFNPFWRSQPARRPERPSTLPGPCYTSLLYITAKKKSSKHKTRIICDCYKTAKVLELLNIGFFARFPISKVRNRRN
jgi:hypothetical protein